MATVLKPAEPQRIDHFFSMPAARADRWRELTALANDWSSGTGSVAAVESALEALGPIEEFHAFPGRRVMSRLRDRLGAGSAEAFAEFARQISRSIVTRQYKQGLIDRQSDDALVDGSDTLVDTFDEGEKRRPYFEMLVVTPAAAMRNDKLAGEMRRLRRPEDAFVYETVQVSSFEDAISAAVINPAIAAVTIYEGFTQASRHAAPILRSFLDATGLGAEELTEADRPLALANALKRIRPELDLYLLSDRRVESVAGDERGGGSAPRALLG